MITKWEEARRLGAEITQAIENNDANLDGHMWGVHDYEHVRNLVMAGDVEALSAALRVLLPLQKEFRPGIIGATVQNIRQQGVENAGDLVTRESKTLWMYMVDEINDYGVSMGDNDIVVSDLAQEVFLLAFTEPDIARDAVAVVKERGLLPVDMIRGLVTERKNSVAAVYEGAL